MGFVKKDQLVSAMKNLASLDLTRQKIKPV